MGGFHIGCFLVSRSLKGVCFAPSMGRELRVKKDREAKTKKYGGVSHWLFLGVWEFKGSLFRTIYGEES